MRAIIEAAGPRNAPGEPDLAERMGVSPRTLRRRLGEEGWSYRELLASVRVERAKKLLETTAEPITAVGYRVGYDNASAFARAFRTQVGVSPSRYRRMRRGPVG